MNEQLKVSDAGLQIIKESEGCQLTQYICPAGKLTIGYGHTGKDVKRGMTITLDEATALLKLDCIDAEKAIKRLVKVPLKQYQFDALASLVYNIGAGNFEKSTLLKKLNNGDYDGAGAEFIRWKFEGARELRGLVIRREKEQALFLNKQYVPDK